MIDPDFNDDCSLASLRMWGCVFLAAGVTWTGVIATVLWHVL